MEESTFSSTTTPNSSTSKQSVIRNQIKPPVQLTSPITSETQISTNDDDDGDCRNEGESIDGNEDGLERKYVERQPETNLDL